MVGPRWPTDYAGKVEAGFVRIPGRHRSRRTSVFLPVYLLASNRRMSSFLREPEGFPLTGEFNFGASVDNAL